MGYTVLAKQQLSENVYQMRIAAPLIASQRKPGQFILLSVDDNYGERIRLTIADADTAEGSITIIFQKVGYTTGLLAGLEPGDSLAVLLGLDLLLHRWLCTRGAARFAALH